ncbi:TRAP transporter small permease [Roseibium denhamense]|uniref:TRAP transporter small permease protein n=1 Tax=Roseibium denhamense TaxID=76305 RepID=A0ABY1N9G0_9HYPH|nr:TRAP transporter small permease [Roseibium denhamense]MTI05625.1 TRAP transporter small permease [Roseibium denhamense]SMP03298.1 TRAP-type C4-dicarboxylate transport system, small permease component [Roseibium denhamense]
MEERPEAKAPDWRHTIQRWVSRLLGGACLLILAALIGLTTVDVIARYFFNSPVSGAYELTQLLLAALIFCALPLTTGAGEHIEVELLDGVKSKSLKLFGAALAGIATAGTFLMIALELVDHAEKLQRRGTVTDSLEIPLALAGWLGAASFALSAFAAVTWSISRIRKEA